MKRIIPGTALVLLTLSFNTHAQIKIISNGNVGVGLESPSEKLHINGAIRGNQSMGALQIKTQVGYVNIGSTQSSCVHYTTGASYHFFDKGIISGQSKFCGYNLQNLSLLTCNNYTYTTRMTVNYTYGYVGINNTSPSYMLDVNGIVRATSYLTSSDIRLKKDIEDLPAPSVNNLFSLKPIKFKPVLRTDKEVTGIDPSIVNDTAAVSMPEIKQPETTMYGFSAQEVQKIFPDLVSEDEQGYLSVDYIGLIPVLVEALKTQQVRIADLEKKVASLTAVKPK